MISFNMSEIISNKRIAKNTIFLYMKMVISIVVNLYTMRVLWQVLGVDNYGIYSVVGGIVMMFAFLNYAMIATSQRFISYDLGKGDIEQLTKTFNISLKVHLFLAFIILVLTESVGLWFLNARMNIPDGRMIAANCVYQCSIVTFLISVISVPCYACIVAHEHMKEYGYFGVLEVILKLLIVLIVAVMPCDKLIAYAALVMTVALLMGIIYTLYCVRNFQECRLGRFKDRKQIKDMFSFAGWSFVGNVGFAVRDQGMNILINLFYNVAVNAAKGIAANVGSVIYGFSSNFTMAINPQITKRYAAGEHASMITLMYNGGKISMLLLSMVVIPVLVAAPEILKIWLVDVAPYTVGFLRLTLLTTLVDCVTSPITTTLQATGKIRKFQIVISVIQLSTLPISWVCLKLGGNPYVVMYVALIATAIAVLARLMILHEQVAFSYSTFVKEVYARTIPAILLSGGFAWWIYNIFPHSIIGLLLFSVTCVIFYIISGFFIALTKSERIFVVDRTARFFHLHLH